MKLKDKVSWLMGTVQKSLFPYLDESLPDPLTEPEKRLVKILEFVKIEKHVPVSASRQWLGRPIKEREAVARAFIAKAVLKYQHTRSLRNESLSTPNLRMICGFSKRQDVPSESTFSRAFAEFAVAGLGTLVHDALIEEYMRSELIGHVSRDSMAIIGREKPTKKIKPPRVAKKRGRPAKGEERPPVEPKRLEVQRSQSAAEAIALLPAVCNRGTKKNAKGYKESWNGYKLHLDVNDYGLPLSAVLTSASVHDSQVAMADGALHPGEEQMLLSAKQAFGLHDSVYQSLHGRFVGHAARTSVALNKHYEILGIGEDADKSTIKKAYRKKAAEFHPDKIEGKGLPPEFIRFANDKLAEINASYEAVVNARAGD